MFCASDIGWVVGHSYILYAPLLVGATTILFEGKPVGTPDAGTFWRVVAEHKANVLFTAPTALRAIRKEDPDNKYFEKIAGDGNLRHVRALFLAGERSEPSIVRAYQDLLTKHAAPGALVVDNWWSSESGSPISGLALRSAVGRVSPRSDEHNIPPLAIRPGSAGLPMPGFDVRVVDDEGNEVPQGTMGNIVMATPLAPTAFTRLFNDDDRFYKGYLKRFNGRWLDTGDAGMIDQDGYIHVMSRSDDIINVAAHRFSTGIYLPYPIPSTYTYTWIDLTQKRFHRTSNPLAPGNRRSQRCRYPRSIKRPPPVCLCYTKEATRWRLAGATIRRFPKRREWARPRTNRRDCVARRDNPGPRDDSENTEWENTTKGLERIGGERGEGRV